MSLCSKCSRKCKQDSYIIVDACPDFVKVLRSRPVSAGVNKLEQRAVLDGKMILRIPMQHRDPVAVG